MMESVWIEKDKLDANRLFFWATTDKVEEAEALVENYISLSSITLQ